MQAIAREVKTDPELAIRSPVTTPKTQVSETMAACNQLCSGQGSIPNGRRVGCRVEAGFRDGQIQQALNRRLASRLRDPVGLMYRCLHC